MHSTNTQKLQNIFDEWRDFLISESFYDDELEEERAVLRLVDGLSSDASNIRSSVIEEAGDISDELLVRNNNGVYTIGSGGNIIDMPDLNNLPEGTVIHNVDDILDALDEGADIPEVAGTRLGSLRESLESIRGIDRQLQEAGELIANDIDELAELAGRPQTSKQQVVAIYNRLKENLGKLLDIKGNWRKLVRKMRSIWRRTLSSAARRARRVKNIKSKDPIVKAQKDLEKLRRKLARKSIKYSNRLINLDNRASVLPAGAKARLRAAASVLGGTFRNLDRALNYLSKGKFRFQKTPPLLPGAQVKIDPEIQKLSKNITPTSPLDVHTDPEGVRTTGERRPDPRSAQARTRYHGQDVKDQIDWFKNRAAAAKDRVDDILVEINKTPNPIKRRRLEGLRFYYAGAEKLYNEAADNLDKLHTEAPRGLRLDDLGGKKSLSLFKNALWIALIANPFGGTGAAAVSIGIAIRAAAIALTMYFFSETYDKYYDQFKTYVGDTMAMGMITSIESGAGAFAEIATQVGYDKEFGDLMLEILREKNQSFIDKTKWNVKNRDAVIDYINNLDKENYELRNQQDLKGATDPEIEKQIKKNEENIEKLNNKLEEMDPTWWEQSIHRNVRKKMDPDYKPERTKQFQRSQRPSAKTNILDLLEESSAKKLKIKIN